VNSREFRDQLQRRIERAALAALEPVVVDRLETYWRLLEHWSRTINLTALPLATDAAFDRLLVEPLCAGPLVPDTPLSWFDVGSGGGSPAVPLKIVRPQACLRMVESRSRKAAFLREVVRVVALPDAEVINNRFERLVASADLSADLITLRGVRLDDALVDSVSLALRAEGRLLWFDSAREDARPLPSRFQVIVTKQLAIPNAPQLLLFARNST
jgi:16S rRNA (guanine(527)-N(7))-methyltransferase RsmG